MGLFSRKPHVCGETNHRFEPRYHKAQQQGQHIDVEVLGRAVNVDNGYDMANIISAAILESRTYVHDICTRCGKVVK